MLEFYNHSKILLNIKEFEAKSPIFLEIDPSMYCNHECIWCRYGHDNKKLTYEFMIGKLAKYPKIKGIRITGGGEPLTNPDTVKFIKDCFYRGMTVGLETNGVLLNDKTIDIIAKSCRYCRISLDAGCDETHTLLHRPKNHGEDFTKIIYNIRKLAKEGIRELGISFLVVEKNLSDIVKLSKLNLPIDYVHFKPLITGTDESILKEALNIIKTTPYYNTIKTRYDRLEADELCNGHVPCRVSELIRRIGGDGVEYVCCEHAYDNRFVVGKWDGSVSNCKTCRYNLYNEILESYYTDAMTKGML